MASLLFIKSSTSKSAKIWGYLCLSVSVWAIGSFMYSSIDRSSRDLAFFWIKISYLGVIITPTIFFHFVYEYIKLNKPRLLTIIYSITGFFVFMNLFYDKFFLVDIYYAFDQFYWHDWISNKSLLFITHYIFSYWILLLSAFLLLILEFLSSKGQKRQQLKYFIFASLIGWLGAEGDYFPVFRLAVYPAYFNILIAIYPLIMGYAIIRYRLMDINVVITRTSIFVAVYSFVLGIPFAMAFGWQEQLKSYLGENWWIIPLVSSTILATLGPFIYLYIQKKAEAKLFQEQHRYQSTLRKASLGMGRIKDLTRLLNLIVQIVTRTVRIEHCEIYLFDESHDRFLLKASKNIKPIGALHQSIPINAPLIQCLHKIKEPIVFEEVKQRAVDDISSVYSAVCNDMQTIETELILPTFVEDRLLAFISLGKMKSGKAYGQSDLVVFSILANQAALAIENAQFYEDMKKTHEQLFKAEKMATIGTMADGLSHQINNRLHAMGFIAGDALDTINLSRDKIHNNGEAQKVISEIEYALNRIQDNVKRGGEIVEGLLKYTRKGTQGFVPVDFDRLLAAAIEMASFKIKVNMLRIEKHFDAQIPEIYGNFTQLQEVFFNLIDNAYDAMMQRKEDLQEEGYQPQLDIYASGKGKNLEIIIKDNGMGVKQEDMKKLFTPFFTTKLSSRKGTGLGLYVIRQLIEESHKGKVYFSSEYKKGSQTILILPIKHEL